MQIFQLIYDLLAKLTDRKPQTVNKKTSLIDIDSITIIIKKG